MAARVQLAGIPLDPLDLPAATATLDRFVRSGRPHQVVTVNLDFLAIARRDPAFRQVLGRAALALADGQPLVWTARRYGTPVPARVAGVDLLDAACALAARRGYRPFLLGAGPGVAARAAAVLEARHPGLRVAGVYSPPYGELGAAEEGRMVAAVRAARPDLLFVALGAPRQDVWIGRQLGALGVPVCMGVGGALDLVAGRVPRAPGWMQRVGLEWGFRLVQEPGRLWKRYLVDDVPELLRLWFLPNGGYAAESTADASSMKSFDQGDLAPVATSDANIQGLGLDHAVTEATTR
jgi:N-acetylglucosaminyldiphosphoundecaprenol N-acetyl-beta-D-mannosaminyltransferase